MQLHAADTMLFLCKDKVINRFHIYYSMKNLTNILVKKKI